MRSIFRVIVFTLSLLGGVRCEADLVATFNSATDVSVTASSYTASGTFNATLNFAPTAGTALMVVKNTGVPFISGEFSNLAQGQVVVLPFGGINFRFVANYHGGTGNDLVLQWAQTRLVAWGANSGTQLGDHTNLIRTVPTNIPLTGALAGKTILTMSGGWPHSLALCSDGTVASWGGNYHGETGTGTASGTTIETPADIRNQGALAGKQVIAVSSGEYFSLALTSDGTVAAWGTNNPGIGSAAVTHSDVPVAVDTSGILAGKTVVAISVGYDHALALCSDGTVAAWGFRTGIGLPANTLGSAVPIAIDMTGVLAGKKVMAVAAGDGHSLVLTTEGKVYAWGSGSSGELGNGSASNSTVPVAVDTTGVLNGKTVVAIAARSNQSLALCSDGTVATWGDILLGTSAEQLRPFRMNTQGALVGRTCVGVVAGEDHYMARCADGTLLAWGSNSGLPGINSSVPIVVGNLSLGTGEAVADCFTGFSNHQFVLVGVPPAPKTSDSSAADFTLSTATLRGVADPNGNPATAHFEYGLDASYGSRAEVVLAPPDGLGPQSVSASLSGLTPGTIYHYRLVVTSTAGTASTGDRTFATSNHTVFTFQTAADISRSASVLAASGATITLGLNFAPPTGTTLTVLNNTGSDWIQGRFANLAQGQVVVLSYGGISYRFVANYYGGDGNDLVLQWASVRPMTVGNNDDGQLGDNTTTDRTTLVNIVPSPALTGKDLLQMAGGGRFSVALAADGTLAAWGNTNLLGNGSGLASRTPVAVDQSGVLAGKTVVSLAAGKEFTVALCDDGTLVAWGLNAAGQLGNKTTTTALVPVLVDQTGVLAGRSVTAIAAGDYHCLALCSDGTLAAWGSNSNGQLGDESEVFRYAPVLTKQINVPAGQKIVAIGAGSVHSIALCSDGTVLTWGDNFKDQLGNNRTNPYSSTSSYVLAPTPVYTSGVLAGKTVVKIAAGGNHNLALCSDGTLVVWGYNFSGQLGIGSTTQSRVPVLVNTSGVLAGKTVAAIAAGASHNVVRCTDGSVGGWGDFFSSNVPITFNTSALAATERMTAAFTGGPATHVLALVSLPLPVVAGVAHSNLSTTGVTLRGTVTPNGSATMAYFEYGPDTNYGQTAAVVLAPNSGFGVQNVSANLSGFLTGTTYHYRLTATNVVGTASSADVTFTTPPGGTMTLGPASPFDAGAPLTVTFAGWTDASLPLTYAVLVDDIVVSPQASSSVCSFAAPAIPGAHTLKGRVYNALGNYAELSQSFTVYTAQESWRAANFGTPQNTGNAADTADPDGDGCNNWFEYVAGLTPTDAASRFQVRVDMVAGQPGQKAIVFGPVMPGRTYTVKSKAGLTDATWTALTNFTTTDNGAERTILDLNAGNDLRFYEVEITLP